MTLCTTSVRKLLSGIRSAVVASNSGGWRRYAVIGLAGVSFGVQAQDAFIQAHEDPKHLIKMATARYRVYELLLNPGESTQYHQHTADNFSVILSHTDLTNEAPGGTRREVSVKPGSVSFATASPAKPYVHRLLVRGEAPFHALMLEMVQAPPDAGVTGSPEQVDAALAVVSESPRGRAYRLNLETKQSAKLPSRKSDLLLVCLSEGTVVQQVGNRQETNLDCRTGEFRLLENADETILKNPAAARVELAVIAIR